MSKQFLFVLVLVAISSTAGVRGQSPTAATKHALPDFDVREQRDTDGPSNDQIVADAIVERRNATLASFVASPEQIQLGTRIVPNGYGLPKLYLRDGHALSVPSALKPTEIAKEFLRAQPEIFSLGNAEVDRLRLVVDDVTDHAKFLAFNQTLNGIDVFNGQVKFTLNKDGEVIQVATGDVVPGLNIPTVPRLTPEEVVKAAF